MTGVDGGDPTVDPTADPAADPAADAKSDRSADSDRKRKIVNRLRRIEGQVRGLQKMVEDERTCQEILTLLSGVRSALEATGDLVLETYFEKCQADVMEGKAEVDDVIRTLKLARG